MNTSTTFSLNLYTDIVFGRGVEAEAGRMTRKYAALSALSSPKILVVYGGGSVKRSGLFDRVTAALDEAGLAWTELGGVRPNPRRSLVETGIAAARREGVNFVLGLGGGSAIDTAKAIALALANNGEYWAFYHGTQPAGMAPVGTIHTISAAGSETSRSTVLVDDIGGEGKRGLNWDCCRPVFALMNPELTYTVAAYQTGAGAADILAHTVSRYFSRGAADETSRLGDEFAEGLMRTVARCGPIAVACPTDWDARSELMLAASFSHNDLTGLGRTGPRGGEHPLEHQISGHYDTAHGAGLAAVMPAWLGYVVDHGTRSQADRVRRFCEAVFGDPSLDAFRAWVRSLGMPLTLADLGIPAGDVPAMTARCMAANGGKIVGFMDLDEAAVAEIYGRMAVNA